MFIAFWLFRNKLRFSNLLIKFFRKNWCDSFVFYVRYWNFDDSQWRKLSNRKLFRYVMWKNEKLTKCLTNNEIAKSKKNISKIMRVTIKKMLIAKEFSLRFEFYKRSITRKHTHTQFNTINNLTFKNVQKKSFHNNHNHIYLALIWLRLSKNCLFTENNVQKNAQQKLKKKKKNLTKRKEKSKHKRKRRKNYDDCDDCCDDQRCSLNC